MKFRRVACLPLGWSRRVSRLTAARHPGGAARLISLRHPWLRSNRRPLAGRPCPASFPTTLTAPPGCPAAGDRGRVRASSPAGATGMSEPVGADLPVARDGAGQLSKEVLRSPAARAPCLERTAGYRLQVPGECEERLSDSVAPEHLCGGCQPVRCPPRLTRPVARRQKREARACIPRGAHQWPDLGTRCGYGALRLCGRRRSSSGTR